MKYVEPPAATSEWQGKKDNRSASFLESTIYVFKNIILDLIKVELF
jgi:hypothetical protein